MSGKQLLGGRLALALEYDGSAFFGWQSQAKPHVDTVQDALEKALGFVASLPVRVQCAGRTDRAVHASHQLVHFDAPVSRPAKAWLQGGNANLPAGVSLKWVQPVPDHFHARFSAVARRYRYIIYNHPVRPAHLRDAVTWQPLTLDARKMHAEAQALLGERDFSAYRAAGCQSRTPMRNVHFIEVVRRGELVVVDIQANAFLHHMVRNIVGVLMAVGTGQAAEGWAEEVLESRDRRVGGVTAKPNGLYLVDVLYPDEFSLPATELGPFFLNDTA